MKLFPAIDLRDGAAVRLYQGDYARMTVYNPDPVAQAKTFLAAGADCLHVVDLDAARGEPSAANREAIAALAALPGLRVEVGGGIRQAQDVQRMLALGVWRCILGTAAVRDFPFAERMARAHGPAIAVGVDLRDGLVAVNGWQETTPEPGVAFCRRCAAAGVRTVIATDISRDGTMQGANRDLYRQLLAIPGLEVVASGGIATLAELQDLRAMGCHGAILGKSLYTGSIDLAAALAAMQG